MDRVHTLRAPLSSRRRRGLFGTLLALMDLDRSRRRLEDLDEHLLRDVGLTRGEARREAERPVWDAPNHWLS